MTKAPTDSALTALYDEIARCAADADVFESVAHRDAMLECAARHVTAFYRVFEDDGRVWVALVTPDRWLSQSIEQDLVFTGDKLDELIEEEMGELGYRGQRLPYEHFRDEQKLFTFRSPMPFAPTEAARPASVEVVTQALLGYEAAFRRLGDMEGGGDDE